MRDVMKGAAVLLLVVAVAASGSATVNSCDQLTFTSNGDKYNGDFLTCSFTSDKNTDAFDLSYSSSDLQDSFPDGEPNNGFSLQVTDQRNVLQYGFRDTGMLDLYRLTQEEIVVEEVNSLDDVSTARQKIIDELEQRSDVFDLDRSGDVSINDFAYSGELTWSGYQARVGYVSGYHVGSVAQIDSSPQPIFETTWQLEAGDTSAEKVISNGDVSAGQSISMAGGAADITWTGSNIGEELAPTPTDELVVHSNYMTLNLGYESTFLVINENEYDQWTASLDDVSDNLQDRYDSYGQTSLSESDVVRVANNQMEDAFEEHSNSEFTDARLDRSDSTIDFSWEASSLELERSNLYFPEFQVNLDVCQYAPDEQECSALLQVEKQVGVPQINDVSSEQFRELDTGYVDVGVENIGNGRGSFSVNVRECSSGFTAESSQRVLLDSGETRDLSFSVSASSTSSQSREFSGSCSVVMKELNTGEEVTATADLTAVQQEECDPGREVVQIRENSAGESYQVVQQCGSDGLELETIKECEPGEQAEQEGGDWVCKESTGEVTLWIVEDESCVADSYPVESAPSNAYSSKGACEATLSGGEVCLVNQNVAGQQAKFGCISEQNYNRGLLIIILLLGVIGGSLGLSIGRVVEGELEIKGRFNPFKDRSVSRKKRGAQGSWTLPEIVGLVIGFGVGAALGWYLGYAAIALAVLLTIAKIYIPWM